MDRRRFLATAARAGISAAAIAALPPALREALAAAPPRIIERNEWPRHWETTLAALDGTFFTRNDDFFLRSHLSEGGRLDPATAAIAVDGLVRKPGPVSISDLRAMPQHEMAVTLECAGNGRGLFRLPSTAGTQWSYGAVGTAQWRGVRLGDLLERVGATPEATDVWARGADWLDIGNLPAFERSIPMKVAREQALIALEMNGEPLPFFHGGPFRLIVPGWYAMASVKWIESLRVDRRPSDNHFMVRGYRYQYPGDTTTPAPPVETMRVKSLITSVREGDRIARTPFQAGGWAWSGAGGVTRAEGSIDGGATWKAARLGESRGEFAWRRWELDVTPARPGPLKLAVRATDANGDTQPEAARVNAAGYANNSIHRVTVHVR